MLECGSVVVSVFVSVMDKLYHNASKLQVNLQKKHKWPSKTPLLLIECCIYTLIFN